MPTVTIDLTVKEWKILTKDMADPREWAENALLNKLRQVLDREVSRTTDRQPKKLTHSEKLAMVD